MTTSQTSFLSEITGKESIPLGKLSYFRERLRNRLYDLVVSQFHRLEQDGKISRASLARRIGRKPEQITRWLGSPGNWTLDTVSDLLIAMGAEADLAISNLEEQPPRNFSAPEWLSRTDTLPLEATLTSKRKARASTSPGLGSLKLVMNG